MFTLLPRTLWLAPLALGTSVACAPLDTVPQPAGDVGDAREEVGLDATADVPDASPEDDAALDATDVLPDTDGPAPVAPKPLHTPEAPGADWYNYDGRTHAVTPREATWIASNNQRDIAVAITSYYDRRGESGYFSVRVRTRAAGGNRWSDAQPLALTQSVKEAPVCIVVSAAGVPAATTCDQAWDLVFYTEPRVLPTAGFTVRNPALAFAGHHAANHDSFDVVETAQPLDTLPATGFPDDHTVLVSGRVAPNEGPLAQLLDLDNDQVAAFQFTTDFFVARYTAQTTGQDAQATTVQFTYACTVLPPQQAEFPVLPDATQTLDVVVPDGQTVWLDLCGTQGTRTSEPQPVGPRQLPVSDPVWDVILDGTPTGVVLRSPPGSTVRIAPRNEEVPRDLWDDA